MNFLLQHTPTTRRRTDTGYAARTESCRYRDRAMDAQDCFGP